MQRNDPTAPHPVGVSDRRGRPSVYNLDAVVSWFEARQAGGVDAATLRMLGITHRRVVLEVEVAEDGAAMSSGVVPAVVGDDDGEVASSSARARCCAPLPLAGGVPVSSDGYDTR